MNFISFTTYLVVATPNCSCHIIHTNNALLSLFLLNHRLSDKVMVQKVKGILADRSMIVISLGVSVVVQASEQQLLYWSWKQVKPA